MVRVVLDQLVEEGRRLEGPLVVRQEKSQVEQCRAEVLLQLDGLRGWKKMCCLLCFVYGKAEGGKCE